MSQCKNKECEHNTCLDETGCKLKLDWHGCSEIHINPPSEPDFMEDNHQKEF